MNLISDTIQLKDLGQHFESWLNTVLFEDNSDVFNPVEVTNRMVMNTGEYPDGWFNPFTLTVDELDKMREGFTGGFKKWAQFIKDNIPFLDSKEEGKLKRRVNKDRDIRLCGTRCKTKINPLTRKLYHELWSCKRRNCLRCMARKQSALTERVRKIEDGYYTIVTLKESEVLVESNDGNSILRIPIDKDRIMIINNKGIGSELTEEAIKEYVKIPPAGMNISGKLGKNSGVLTASADDDPFEEQVEVSVAEFIVEATQAQMREVEEQYNLDTDDIEPDRLEDCQKAIYQCENILQRIIKDKGLGIFFLYRTKSSIKKKDFLRVKEQKVEKVYQVSRK